MALTDGLIFSIGYMPTAGANAYQASVRSEASPKAGLAGGLTGAIATWLKGSSSAGQVFTSNAAAGQFQHYRYPETSIDKFAIYWPLTTGNSLNYTSNGTGGDDAGDIFLVVQRDAMAIYVYVDNVLTDTFVIAGVTAGAGTQNWNLGTAQCPVGAQHVWDRMLTTDEIAELYNAGFATWPGGGSGGPSGFARSRLING